MRELNNWEPLGDNMGISYANVQRMLIVVAAITIITAFTTMEAFTTAWTAIALSSLVGFAWAVSNRETTFKHLGINSYGFLNALSFVIVTIVFAEWCMSIWDSYSRIVIYALSIVTIATFWWSIEMMEPTVVNDNE